MLRNNIGLRETELKEYLTNISDEAIQNISSLYNKDELTIGNLNITKNAKLNNVSVEGTMNARNIFKELDSINDGTIKKRDIPKEIDDLQKVIVVYPIQWDQYKWVKHITEKKYFTKDMPDGTLLRFLFVHPGNNDVNHTHRWFSYKHAIKYGNQFLILNVNEHHNVPDPLKNASNDALWRGNID